MPVPRTRFVFLWVALIAACGGSASTAGSSADAGSTRQAGPPGDTSSGGAATVPSDDAAVDLPAEASTQDDSGASTTDASTAAPDADAGPTLPLVTDQGATGPFMVTTQASTGPGGDYTLYYPTSIASDATRYPSLVWGNGALATPSNYTTLLDTIASNGFVIIEYDSTPNAQQMTDAIDWLVAQSTASGSMLEGHLDLSEIAAGGHSAGSIAAFDVAADPRLVTTVHLSGGTMSPHTDLANLRHAALFVCGDTPTGAGLTTGDVANPNCEYDFENATVPVFYGMQKGASHLSTYDGIGDDAQRTQFARAIIGWLGWKAVGQQARASLFAGSSCALCNDPAWVVSQRGL
jgi:Chlorophyllase enzyme